MKLVKPYLSKEEALNKLTTKSWPKKTMSPDLVEMVYFPAYLFTVSVGAKGVEKSEQVIVDAISGSFSFLTGYELTDSNSMINHVEQIHVAKNQAREIALDEYRYFLLMKNLKTKIPATINSIIDNGLVYYPFWIGYFRHKHHFDYKVIDAVSGSLQGSRLKPAVTQYIVTNQ